MARNILSTITGLPQKKAVFVLEYVKDFSPRRAAEAAGYAPDTGYRLVQEEQVQRCVEHHLAKRLEASDIDAEWLLMEAVDNHQIARQHGKINASNAALNLIARHVFVDAMAANRMEVELTTDSEIRERLRRGRQRLQEHGRVIEGETVQDADQDAQQPADVPDFAASGSGSSDSDTSSSNDAQEPSFL